MKLKFTPDQGWEKALAGAALAAIEPYFAKVRSKMSDLRDAARDRAEAIAAQTLTSPNDIKKYSQALEVEESNDGKAWSWTLTLGADAIYLEEGYDGYDMIDAGLAKGSKSKYSEKTGRRYVKVPFEHLEAAASKKHPMNPTIVQKAQGGTTTKGDMASDLRNLRKIFAPDDTGISLDSQGNPIKGKVWSISKATTGPQWEYREFATDMRKRMDLDKSPSSLLSGVTKVQFETGKGTMKSRYLTWRTATDPRTPDKVHNKPNWIHPGFKGIKAFEDVEKYINEEFARIVNDVFNGAS